MAVAAENSWLKAAPPGTALLLAASAALASPPEQFGIIDISGHRHPQFILDEPRRGNPAATGGAPVVLHVPREHIRYWHRFCQHYTACDRPAFFVSEEWYYGIFLGKAADRGPDAEEIVNPRAGLPAAE